MSGMIASVGPGLPLELLRASGRYAGALPIDLDRQVTSAGEWLESKFAPWAPLLLQGWADGDYDHLSQVLFTRADDTAQRLYYYVCELQRRGLVGGPEALMFDVAMIPRPSSLARTEQKLRDLGDLLGVDAAALEAALEEARPDDAVADGPVCLLHGSPPPDRRLHAMIEAAGFTPVGPTLADHWNHRTVLARKGSGDPFAALAASLCEDTSGPRSFADRGAALARRLEAAGARAAVLWRIEEDEAEVWHLPAERRALEASGLPHLVLTRRDWFARDGVAGEIAAFLGGVAK